MGDSLRVLVYGSVDGGPCDSVRLGVYRDLLRDHGVEMRTWGELNNYRVQIPGDYAGRLDDAVRDGVAEIDTSPIEWADVLVFRRWYATIHACDECDFAAPDAPGLDRHAAATGHAPVTRDRIVRPLLASIEKDRAVLRGRAVVYELDDGLLSAEPWLGFYDRLQGDRDLIERFARSADLVTASTPTLAKSLARFNSAVRVVRNAVVPEWYDAPAPGASPPPEAPPLTFLYYGTAARLRDYALCRGAVDETARRSGGRRVWLGSDDPGVRAIVDETLPFVPEVRGFARRLAEARPSIGLAPVGSDAYSRSRSELHWLEYSLAGAATVASATTGGGPYDVIRDGVDGLLARSGSEWRAALRRLAGSRALREEMAGRARERVVAEYDVRQRAAEWADAFRWAADHAGRGMAGEWAPGFAAGRAVGQEDREKAIEAEAKAGLAHRRLVRARTVEEAQTLARLRGESEVCWPAEAGREPLVSVVFPILNRDRRSLERSIAAALSQAYRNLEVVAIGVRADGGGPESESDISAAIGSFGDARLRFEELEPGSPAGDRSDPNDSAGGCLGTRLFDRGVRLARGSWIAPLAGGDVFGPDHVGSLLSIAVENRLELVYGDAWLERPDGVWARVGEWPPRPGGFHAGAALYAAPLGFIAADPECGRDGEPGDWNVIRRMLDSGVRAGHAETVVSHRYL
jgi:hypothetical protein